MAGLQDLGGGKWRVSVFVGRDEHGRQKRVVRHIQANGKREARSAAQRLEDKLRAEAEQKASTFAEAVEGWWEMWRSFEKSPTTRSSYRSLIDTHILKAPFAKKKVADLKTGQFDRWYSQLPLSPTSVHHIHAIVNQVLDQQVRDGELLANPAAKARKPSARPARRQYTTPEQVVAILKAAALRHPVRARALEFAALTGLRRGEVAAMRWSSIDVERRVMLVERNTVTAQSRFVGPAPAKKKRPAAADRTMVRHDKD